MSQWGIPFDHIENHWTDRQFIALTDAMGRRFKAMNKGRKPAATAPQAGKQVVPFLSYRIR